MSQPTDRAEIEALLERLKKAQHDKDAAASVAEYTPDATVYNLAPPLAAEGGADALAAWFDTWSGPVEVMNKDIEIAVSGDLAFLYGFQQVSATSRQGGEKVSWWMRLTLGLRKIDGVWKVVHEHSSVPFYMDGSFKAALDLEP